MKHTFTLMFIAAGFHLAAQSVHSSLTLQEAMDLSMKGNYDIRIARNSAAAAAAVNTAGNAGALPTLLLTSRDKESSTDIQQEFSNGTIIERNGVSSNVMGADAVVNYTLFNGFRIQASRERLNALQRASDEELLSRIQNTLSDVTIRYFDVVRQTTYKKALERGRDFASKKLEIIDARSQVGLANNADLFQARIDRNTSDQNLAEQDLLIRRAQVDLAQLMAVYPDSIFMLTDSMVIDRNIQRDSVLKFIVNHPQLAAASARVTINEQTLREIRSQRLPSLRLDGGYSYNRSVNSAGFSLLNVYGGPSVGATLLLPLYNGGAIKAQEKAARLQVENALLVEEQTRQLLTSQVIKSYEAYTIALGQLDAQQESFRLSGQVMDIQLMRFEQGQSTILDLRAAQSSYEQSAASLVNAFFVAKIAETELKRLMCKLGS